MGTPQEQENKQEKRDSKGRFKPGVSGNPGGGDIGLKRKSFAIKSFLLGYFENEHVNTGKFAEWAEKESNKEKLYEWVVRLMPKEIDMSGEVNTGEKIVIIRASQQK